MSNPTGTPQAPRIAIKFGAASTSSKPSSASTRKAGQSLPPSALGKRPRSHALNPDSDSENEDDQYGRHETVTTIGEKAETDGRPRDAKTARTTGKTLVIACQAEGGWKAATKTQRGGQSLPHQQNDAFKGQIKETEPADHDKQIKWGLSITKKAAADGAPTLELESSGNDVDSVPADGEANNPASPPKTVDQEAMNALLGIDTDKKKQLIISESEAPQDEFKAAVKAAADVSTIEEYDQIPDGEFGMAMLRGMGLDETKQNARPKEVRRRPALLGLGAKEDEEIKKAEMAKKYGHRDRRPRLDEYRRGEDAKRQQREERHTNSYKHERERDKVSHGSSRRHDDRDRNRDRARDRDGESQRHRDRHSRY